MLGKKILGTVLAASMALSLNVFAATGYNDLDADATTSAALQGAVSDLTGYGVISPDAQGNFAGDQSVKRIDVASMFTNALGYGKLVKIQASALAKNPDAATPFDDISDETTDNQAAAIVSNQKGILKGIKNTFDNTLDFAPQDDVTYGQVATIAVRALGYSEADLDATAAWPYNYVSKAIDLGLFDNIDNADATSDATKADVALIIDKMLNTPTKTQQAQYDTAVATATALGSQNAPAAPKTLMAKVGTALGIKTLTDEVIVDASAVDSTLPANTIKVTQLKTDANGNKYLSTVGTDTVQYSVDPKLANDIATKYLGKSITGFVNTKGVLYSITGSTGKSITFNLSSVNSSTPKWALTGTSLQYSPDGTNLSTITYPNLVKFYWNGKAATKNIATDVSMNYSDETVVFANYDGSDNYTSAFGTAFSKPYVVNTVPTSNVATTQSTLDLLDSSNANIGTKYPITYSSGGNTVASSVYVTGNGVANLTDLKKYDVIYVSATDDGGSSVGASSITIKKSAAAPVSGVVTGSTVNGTTTTALTIGGQSYGFPSYLAVPTLGSQVSYALDSTGKNIVGTISAVNSAVTNETGTFGYIVGASKSYNWGNWTVTVRFIPLNSTTPTDLTYITKQGKSDDNTTDLDNIVSTINKSVTVGGYTGGLVYYNAGTFYYDKNYTPATVATAVYTAGYSFAAAPMSLGISPINVAADTAILNVKDNTWHKSSEYTNYGSLPVVNAEKKSTSSSAMGDYYAIAVNANPNNNVTSNYGYVVGKVGSIYVNGTSYDQYNMFVNGAVQAYTVQPDTGVSFTAGQVFSSYAVNAAGYITSASTSTIPAGTAFSAKTLNPSLSTDTTITGNAAGNVQAITATAIKVAGNVYSLDANCKVYDLSAGAASSLATLGTYAGNASNVAIVVLNNANASATVPPVVSEIIIIHQ